MTDELDQPLITEPQRNARCYHTMRCQYVESVIDDNLVVADERTRARWDIPECEYCRATRCDDVDDPRKGVSQSDAAAQLRDADPDAIGGD